MQGHLVTVDGATRPLSIDSVTELLASDTRFWVDLVAPAEGEVHALLADTFALLVVYGVTADAHLVEVHCFYSAQYLVTVHRSPARRSPAATPSRT